MANISQTEINETTQEGSGESQVRDIELTEVDSETSSGTTNSIDLLLDMEVPVTVIMGKAKMSVKKLLELGPGSVLQLKKSINSPMELYLKDSMFATGKVVVVEDRFAIKVEKVISTPDIAK